jgi:hypothetical protein
MIMTRRRRRRTMMMTTTVIDLIGVVIEIAILVLHVHIVPHRVIIYLVVSNSLLVVDVRISAVAVELLHIYLVHIVQSKWVASQNCTIQWVHTMFLMLLLWMMMISSVVIVIVVVIQPCRLYLNRRVHNV